MGVRRWDRPVHSSPPWPEDPVELEIVAQLCDEYEAYIDRPNVREKNLKSISDILENDRKADSANKPDLNSKDDCKTVPSGNLETASPGPPLEEFMDMGEFIHSQALGMHGAVYRRYWGLHKLEKNQKYFARDLEPWANAQEDADAKSD